MCRQVRNTELSHQLAGAKAGSSTSDTSSLRSLTERAQAAGNGGQNSTKQLALLEQKLAELQAKNGQAENKWEARVKEYENRLRIAGEKIKTEKQGGKERARELEGQVRYADRAWTIALADVRRRELERQVDLARQRNRRVEGVVATAAHLLPPADGMM